FMEMLQKLPDDNVFEMREVKDNNEHLVLFRSSLEAKKDWFLPMVVFLDDTIYTIVRVWTMTDAVNDGNRVRVREYLMEMNRRYKVFKYYDTDQGDIVLDACIPSSADAFEPEDVAIIIDVVWDHLKETYGDLEKAGQ
ncbi:MAG: histidine kinase, partial [Schwartzia sp.]|nr:histidine kinase [Schwartzia sp. (in: firmicutes)]